MDRNYINNYEWECQEKEDPDNKGDKIVCDDGEREIQIKGGTSSNIEITDGDIEVESDGRGNITLTGGRQNDEVLDNDKVERRFSNRQMVKKQ